MRVRAAKTWALALVVFSMLVMGCSTVLAPKEHYVEKPQAPPPDPYTFDPEDHGLNQSLHYLDNRLGFAPKRVWRLWASWDPDPNNKDLALVDKRFYLVVREPEERKKLEDVILVYGGDDGYLQWLENHLLPIGDYDQLDRAKISRLQNLTVVLLAFKSVKSRQYEKSFKMDPVEFPDPLFNQLVAGCAPHDWDAIERNDSFGFEIVLQSRSLTPEALKWQPVAYESPYYKWQSWSVGQGRQVAYRTVFKAENSFARCPLPKPVFSQISKLKAFRNVGIQW
jgi:hypothetical protein